MRTAVIVVAAALLAIAAARCPNSCSGHGDCGNSDKCACWPNWQGYDCSERTCEFDVAWATDARQNPHYYAECSGKGICDRSTGLCACFDGYTGSACRRSVCPNDCSGHGKCRLVSELAQATQAKGVVSFSQETAGPEFAYAGWDGDKIQACVCDGGFFGPDCSLRYCPKGDDPLTTCTETIPLSPQPTTKQIQQLTLSTTMLNAPTNAHEAQTVETVPDGAGVINGGTVSLTNIGAETATFDFDATNAEVEAAIEAAAEAAGAAGAFAADVTVSQTAGAQGSVEWTITFNSAVGNVAVLTATDALTDNAAGNPTVTVTDNVLAVDTFINSFFASSFTGDLALHFTDNTGEVWTTGRIADIFNSATDEDDLADKVKAALEDIPNFRVPHVSATGVAQSISSATRSVGVQVTFDTNRVSGNQNLLSCDPLPLGCQSAGCQPMYDQPRKVGLLHVYSGPTGSFAARTGGNVFFDAVGTSDVKFTDDSVFDNSALTGSVDQGVVAITFRAPPATLTNQMLYKASWSFSGAFPASSSFLDLTSAGNIAGCSTGPYCAWSHVPLADSDGGIGHTHIPVGYGMYIAIPFGIVDGTDFPLAVDEEVTYTFAITTFRCAVTEVQNSDDSVEDIECSGRGTCDRSTGTCSCFEGHYGDHCSLQTILV